MNKLTYAVLLALVACAPVPAVELPQATPAPQASTVPQATGNAQAGQTTQQTTVAPPSVSTSKPGASTAPREYRIGPGDTIKVDFIGIPADDKDMNKDYLVQSNGAIEIKYLDSQNVDGKTQLEVADMLRDLLENKKLFAKGQVTPSVTMAAYRDFEVSVGGAVRAPGVVRLSGDNNSVMRAIVGAGGFSPTAGTEVEIIRASVPGMPTVIETVTREQLEMNDDPGLQEDDRVNVKLGHVFYVNGEVNDKGEKPWKPGMTVSTALVIAGGQTEKFSLGRSHIQRPVKDKDGKILKYEEIKKLKLETPILPDDTLVAGRKLM